MKIQHNIETINGERYEASIHFPASKGWRSLNSVTALCQIRTTAVSETQAKAGLSRALAHQRG